MEALRTLAATTPIVFTWSWLSDNLLTVGASLTFAMLGVLFVLAAVIVVVALRGLACPFSSRRRGPL
ncbi:hypothetical protein BKA25_002543 [Actinoalloteichus hymeniacidonis]|uniref:Uncharacterized protein n=1 Tax=Actinoalloteichus hymeniacidonis TaxID=340345 RepID=A0AAC9MYV7_9PSEU|nr:hypothetical protein TL08_14535 [Actinoalloteichus hymeniacidonis]MBB5908227.1 hypothetical protein [Actinoalloteichus hymeniacidonis]